MLDHRNTQEIDDETTAEVYRQDESNSGRYCTLMFALAFSDHVLNAADLKALQYMPHSNALNGQRPAYHRWSGTITWRKGLWPT